MKQFIALILFVSLSLPAAFSHHDFIKDETVQKIKEFIVSKEAAHCMLGIVALCIGLHYGILHYHQRQNNKMLFKENKELLDNVGMFKKIREKAEDSEDLKNKILRFLEVLNFNKQEINCQTDREKKVIEIMVEDAAKQFVDLAYVYTIVDAYKEEDSLSSLVIERHYINKNLVKIMIHEQVD